MGMAAGFRIGEFGQSDSNSNIKKPQKNKFGEVMGFTAYDLSFSTKDNLALSATTSLAIPWEKLTGVKMTYRTQKNGCNGQDKLYGGEMNSRNNPLFHFSRAAQNVLGRTELLLDLPFSTTKPLSIYLEKGKIKLLNAKDFQYYFRLATAAVYNLNPQKKKHRELLIK